VGPTLLSYPSSSSHTQRSGGTAREQRDGPSRTVGVDGFLSGGGFSLMLWKHGLASDLVVDANMVNAEGEAPQQGRHGGGPLLGHPRRQRRELLRVVLQNQNVQFESLYLGSRHTPWPRRRHGRHLPGARGDGERLHRDDVDPVHALLRVLLHGEAIGDAPGQGH
ncbi:Os08g0525100, partial [Oryza sativa Japonica Group]